MLAGHVPGTACVHFCSVLRQEAIGVVTIIYIYALDRWDVALLYAGLLIADTTVNENPFIVSRFLHG